MQTTFSEQIEAIRQVRTMIAKVRGDYNSRSSQQQIELPAILKISDAALNDATSTIAAVQFAPSPEWVKLQMEKDPLI